MSGYKRKRSGPSQQLALYRPISSPYKRPRLVVPGVTRKVGFYGRYPGADRMPRSGAGELKFFDRTLDDAVVATAGSVVDSVVLIAQGVTENTRIGRKCTVKSISWRYQLKLPTVDAVAIMQKPDTCRIIMFWDKQCNGVTAAATGDSGILAAASWHSFNNLTNTGRFRVLHDKTITLNPSAGLSDGAGLASTGEVIREGSFYKTCNIPLEFSDTAGAITELRSNNIGVLLISSAGLCGFLSRVRVRFSDS